MQVKEQSTGIPIQASDASHLPRISVVIPTHRRLENVKRLLESLSDQTFSNFEVILVSNFPDPQLSDLIEDWKVKTSHQIEMLISNHLGVNKARNVGLAATRGEFALMLDDDCYLPNIQFLERLVQHHTTYSEVLALGGAYLSPPGISQAGAHYNWICNHWLKAQFAAPRLTNALIGGSVCYKMKTLRDGDLKFDERIRYGGAETEFHERLLALGHKMMFHPDLTVIHDCQISAWALMKKAYLQGFAKTRRPAPAEVAKPEHTSWKTLLRGSHYARVYQRAFAAGYNRGLLKSDIPAQWRIRLSFILIFLTRTFETWPPEIYWKVGRVYHRVMRVYHRAMRVYWFCRRVARAAYGKLYWGFHHVRCEVFGFMRFGWAMIMGIYWRIYPTLNSIKYSLWLVSQALFHFEVLIAAPKLETRAEPLWVVKLEPEDTLEKINPLTELGIADFEIELKDWKSLSTLAVTLSGVGWQGHLLIPALAEVDTIPEIMKARVALTTSQAENDGESILSWLSARNWPYSLQLKLNQMPSVMPLKSFLSRVKPLFISLEMPARDIHPELPRFHLFRWFYKFSRLSQGLRLPWEAYYRYNTSFEIGARVEQTSLLASPPLISIVIPHHQDLENLKLVMRMLDQQSFSKDQYEVIVVDNGIELVSAHDREQIFIENKNLQLNWLSLESPDAKLFLSGQARNLGFRKTRGVIVQYLDSDILLPPNYLAELWDKMENVDVMMAKRSMLREDYNSDQAPSAEFTYTEDGYWESFKRAKRWDSMKNYWKYSCTYCFALRKNLHHSVGPFDPNFTTYGFEDVDLAFRLHKLNARFSFDLPEVYHLFPKRDQHNYHQLKKQRRETLRISALTFFLLRPERGTFALCNSYFPRTLGLWGRKKPKDELLASGQMTDSHAQ